MTGPASTFGPALWAYAILLCAPAAILSGCFSADDFSDCSTDTQCGTARFCENGTCRFRSSVGDSGPGGGADRGVTPDGGLPPDATPSADHVFAEVTLGDEALDFPGAHVLLRNVSVKPGKRLVVRARIIEVVGGVSADGAGNPGGGGGGGGTGAQDPDAIIRATAGEGGLGADALFRGTPAASGESGAASAVGGAGEGGRGGAGASGLQAAAAAAAGGAGGLPGDPDGARDGGPGGPGAFDPAAAGFPDPCALGAFEFYAPGGGGGGGGAGGPRDGCLAGGGGGGGGPGGRGGGTLVLIASERLSVAGRVSARGQAGRPGPPRAGSGERGCGTAAACDEGCDIRSGRGGTGADAEAAMGPGLGGPGAPGLAESGGAGGLGGPGAGGLVFLEAPVVEFRDGAIVDVRGGGEDNGGLLGVVGDEAGEVEVLGASGARECRSSRGGGGQ